MWCEDDVDNLWWYLKGKDEGGRWIVFFNERSEVVEKVVGVLGEDNEGDEGVKAVVLDDVWREVGGWIEGEIERGGDWRERVREGIEGGKD